MRRKIAGWAIAIVAVTAGTSGAQAPSGPASRGAAGGQLREPQPATPSGPYEFAEADSVTHDHPTVENGRRRALHLATHSHSWDTAVLAVRSWGAEQDPWVEVSVGETRIQQYLDANAVGARWLSLSGLREQLAGGAEVTIRTHAVTLEAEAATLRLFDNHLDLQQRILVIAPHPDNAEIEAFGLYADRQASVVTVTAGNAGDMNYRASVSDPAEHYALKGYLRAVDSVTVPWQGNIPPERTANLGYFDGRVDADVPFTRANRSRSL